MKIDEIKARLKNLKPVEKTNTLIKLLSDYGRFGEIAETEQKLLIKRDREDTEKLKIGIDFAIQKGLLIPRPAADTWIKITVDNKTPEMIVNEIITFVNRDLTGKTIALSGESGVGKGVLVEELINSVPNSEKWSNGDIFRVFTYFLLDACPISDKVLEQLSAVDIRKIEERIIIDDKNSIFIKMDKDLVHLDELKNTLLKATEVNIHLPSVAKHLQGEVLQITNRFLSNNKNRTVILEGRKKTLEYTDADFRFELIILRKDILGKRRAAQKLISIMENQINGILTINDLFSMYT